MQGGELRLDGVEPGSVGGQVDGLHVVARKEIVGRPDIGRQVVHDDIDAQLHRIARPEMSETGHDVSRCFALAHSPDQAVGMDILEPVQLPRALLPRIGGPVALWFSTTRPAHSGHWAEFQRTQLVIADDDSAFRATGIERQNPLFLASNSGSSECFQVLVRCQETSSRWSNRRNHSGLTEGNNLCLSK